jgi:transaldolase/glucose-6-phosphate isomerase
MSGYKPEEAFTGGGGGGDPHSNASYRLGGYEPAILSRLAEWTEANTARRIWEKDLTVWSSGKDAEVADRLGWLDLPETMKPDLAAISAFASEIESEGIRWAVLLGIGGSSLAAEVYKSIFGGGSGYPRFRVLDSTHPDAVRAVRDEVDPQHTMFIVASKSGKTVEPLALFEYFFQLLEAGGYDPGRRFAAITDPGTPLEKLASERGFRWRFRAFHDIGGRYSSLSHFGLVPAALIGTDITGYLARGAEIAAQCRESGVEKANPGLVLGAVLAELASAGRDKVTFVTSPSLEAFPQWLEQLIAESTGKDGRGIVPVAGEPRARPEAYGRDRFFVYLGMDNDDCTDAEIFLEAIAGLGHPVARFQLGESLDLAGEMFRWEMAVACAGAALGVNPFDQPDVQKAKTLALRAMEENPEGSAAGAETVPLEDERKSNSALRNLLGLIRPGDYFGINAYLPSSPGTSEPLQEIRASVHARHGVATTLGFGPRYLHSTGQLHKGGPNTGVFLQVVDEPRTDIEVPRRDFTFGQLISAQALGDYTALRDADRRVLRVSLGSDTARGLTMLVEAVAKAVA